jgi:hypothetical protein
LRRQLGRGCDGGPPYGKIRLNTNGWEWKRFSMAAVLEVVPIDRRVGPRGPVGPTTSKKRDAAAMSGNTLPKGDPSGIA